MFEDDILLKNALVPLELLLATKPISLPMRQFLMKTVIRRKEKQNNITKSLSLAGKAFEKLRTF
jgi:hypothetical protein